MVSFALLAGCPESSNNTPEVPPPSVETPTPVKPVRVFVDALLPKLDEKLHAHARAQGPLDEITTYVTLEAARPFRARVDGGLRYANILIDIYSPARATQVFTDANGLNARGNAILSVLDDAGEYMLDNSPFHRERIRKLDEKSKSFADEIAPWPTIQLDDNETEALVTWIRQTSPAPKDADDPETLQFVLNALIHGSDKPAPAPAKVDSATDAGHDSDAGTIEKAPARLTTPVPRVTALIKEYIKAHTAKSKVLAELELRTIDGAMRYARDMRHGKLNRYNWTELNELGGSAAVTLGQLEITFNDLAKSTPEQVPEVFADLHPKHPQYARMLEARNKYRAIKAAGGWKTVRPVSLDLGTRSPRVKELRERLAMEGYFSLPKRDDDAFEPDEIEETLADVIVEEIEEILELDSEGSEEIIPEGEAEAALEKPEEPKQEELKPDPKKQPAYTDQIVDQGLIEAVKTYQRTHQFRDDGKPSSSFWASLNVPVERRLAQIELNLTRWLDTHYDGEGDYIFANIPDFHAEVYRDFKREMRFKIVVGNNKRTCDPKTNKWHYVNATPVQWAELDHLILNPSWYIPQRLYDDQIAPKVKKNPNWLKENGYEEIKHKNGRTTVRQLPGPDNSLGVVKFIFPNPANTYMHDTPQRHYFDYEIRGFSSGCVRVHTPVELAKYLIKTDGQDDQVDVDEHLESGRSRKVTLKKKIPVFTEYYTVRVDDDGHANFLADIYRYDLRDMSGDPEAFDNCSPAPKARVEKPVDNTEGSAPAPAPTNEDFGP